MIEKVAGAALAAFVTVAASSAAHAVVVNPTLTDDRTISGDANGNATALLSQNDFFLRTYGDNRRWRSALEFDLSGLVPSIDILDATLNLRDAGPSYAGRIDVFGYSGNGVIELSDALENTNKVGDFNVAQSTGHQDFSIDVTGFLQSLVASNAGFVGFLLVSEDEAANSRSAVASICSGEGGLGTNPNAPASCFGFGPSLDVNANVIANPVPASLPLMLTALGVVGFMVRRRRRNAAA